MEDSKHCRLSVSTCSMVANVVPRNRSVAINTKVN